MRIRPFILQFVFLARLCCSEQSLFTSLSSSRFEQERIYPNKPNNSDFADAEHARFDPEKTGPLLTIGAVFSGSKIACSAKVKTNSSACLGINMYEEARAFCPEWKIEVTEWWPTGAPKEATFFDPETHWPRKCFFYYETGELAEELDLAPESAQEERRGMPHGASISYYETGDPKGEVLYVYGKKEGQERFFSQKGTLLYEANFSEGVLHGCKRVFSQEGVLQSEEFFEKGVRHGPARLFHEDGTKKTEEIYSHGLLEGKRYCWWKPWAVKEITTWSKGLLHNFGPGQPALLAYDEEGNLTEQKDFVCGVPHGTIFRFFPSGKTQQKASYLYGKKNGAEERFDENGHACAYQNFQSGEICGDGWEKGTQGAIVKTTHCEQPGIGAIDEIDDKGNKIHYSIHHGVLSGPYEERFFSGAVYRLFLFDQGVFSGSQLEYFPSGKMHMRASYREGKRDGVQEEWYESGQLYQRGSFSLGEKEGVFETWFPSGGKEYQAVFKRGVVCGAEEGWYENGEKKFLFLWDEGEKHGSCCMWNDKGRLLSCEEWEKGVPHGVWATWYPSGGKEKELLYKNGQLDGSELSWYEDGKIARQAFWNEGKIEGNVREWHEDGSLSFEGIYESGKPKGTHRYFFPKMKRESQLSSEEVYDDKGRLHGEQKIFYPNGSLKMVAQYACGQLHGTKRVVNEAGTAVFVATYDHGKLEGEVYHLRPNGVEEIQYFKNNHPDGLWQVYYPAHTKQGKMKAMEATFKRGVLEGEYVEFDESGTKVLSVMYQHGKREGVSSVYGRDGSLCVIAEYIGGKQNGMMRSFFPGGAKEREAFFKDGLQEGEETLWFASGGIQSKAFYHAGKLHGRSQEWNEKGILVFEAEYNNGMKSGIFNKYNDDGSPRVFQKYENDVLISKEKKS